MAKLYGLDGNQQELIFSGSFKEKKKRLRRDSEIFNILALVVDDDDCNNPIKNRSIKKVFLTKLF